MTRAPTQAGAQTYGHQLATQGGRSTRLQARPHETSTVAVALYESPPYDLKVPALPVARLSVNLLAGQVSGGLKGDRPACYAAARHSLFLTPAGADAHWRKAGPSRHLNLYFDAQAFGDTLADRPHTGLHAPLLNGRVPGLAALAQQLAHELQQPGALAVEAADSLARLMLVMVARHPHPPRRSANPFSPATLQRLHDYMEAHLGERILVQDLAAVAQLPVNHFAQAFAQQLGLPPHRHVLMLRLRRAVQLLRHSSASLAQVAAACGFSSQQHLTCAMRQHLGTTPGRCRAGLPSVGGQAG